MRGACLFALPLVVATGGGCFIELSAGYYRGDTTEQTLDGYGVGAAVGVYYDHAQSLRVSAEANETILPGDLTGGGTFQLWNQSIYGQADYQFAHFDGDRTVALSGGFGLGTPTYKVRPQGTSETSSVGDGSTELFGGLAVTLPFATAPNWAYQLVGGLHYVNARPASGENMNAVGGILRARLTWSPFTYHRPAPPPVDPTEKPIQ